MFDLFFHPFSAYAQKVLIALYENATPFTPRIISPEDPATIAEWRALWPIPRFPVLREGVRTIGEATAIIEYLDARHPGPVRFVPVDPDAAIETRMRDRIYDNYVMTPVQTIVGDVRRPAEARDAYGVAEARKMLETSYAWLDAEMAGRRWACGESFGLADCAAAPSLFYADWCHPIGEAYPHLRAYRARLNARPSMARAIDEARPFRSFFPLGAPDRD